MVVTGCVTGERITVVEICFGCSSGDSESRSWQLMHGLSVTLGCALCVNKKCRLIMRRQLVGVRITNKRGNSVCLITVPIVLASCTTQNHLAEDYPVVVREGSCQPAAVSNQPNEV